MRNLYFTLAIAALFCLGACQQGGNSGNNSSKGQTIAPTNGKLPVAYVNIDTLKLHHELFADLEERMTSEQRKAKRQFTAKQQQFQTEVQNFQRRAQGGLVSQKEMEEKRQEFGMKEQELMIQERNLSQGLAITEQDLLKEWFETLTDYLEEYNKDKGYQLIFPYQSGTFLYANDALDITEEVLEGLNKQYEENKDKEKEEDKDAGKSDKSEDTAK